MDVSIEVLKPILRNLFFKGIINAIEGYEILTNVTQDDENTTQSRVDQQMRVALAYLNQAYSDLSQVKSLADLTQNSRSEIDECLSKFESFNDEFLTSEATNHDHGHTASYFNDFVKTFYALGGLLDVSSIDTWIEKANKL